MNIRDHYTYRASKGKVENYEIDTLQVKQFSFEVKYKVSNTFNDIKVRLANIRPPRRKQRKITLHNMTYMQVPLL